MNYKQCILRKGNAIQTAWIPEQYAVQGKIISIKDDHGWEIVTASVHSKPYEEINDLSQDHKRTRNASDI
jgi:hypothetical protein